jgi:hypothetical protein
MDARWSVQGERIPGGFIIITGLDGIRYAVRPQSIALPKPLPVSHCSAKLNRSSIAANSTTQRMGRAGPRAPIGGVLPVSLSVGVKLDPTAPVALEQDVTGIGSGVGSIRLAWELPHWRTRFEMRGFGEWEMSRRWVSLTTAAALLASTAAPAFADQGRWGGHGGGWRHGGGWHGGGWHHGGGGWGVGPAIGLGLGLGLLGGAIAASPYYNSYYYGYPYSYNYGYPYYHYNYGYPYGYGY